MVCTSCGNVINESHIVSEVTFGETSSGAATVQGGYVGDEQRHANTMGASARRLGLGGGDGRSTAESNGQDAVRGLMTALRMAGESLESQAMNIYRLAARERFTHGRRPIVIAACCLYYICRTRPGNKYLLIDFAEKIKVGSTAGIWHTSILLTPGSSMSSSLERPTRSCLANSSSPTHQRRMTTPPWSPSLSSRSTLTNWSLERLAEEGLQKMPSRFSRG